MLPRRQRRRRSAREAPNIPVDAFSDIAFLLIIFFILATTLVKTMGIVAELPSGEKADTQAEDKTPIVNLADGRLAFNDQPVELGDLRLRLAGLRLAEKPETERMVMFEATGAVNFQQYYEVMAAIAAAGGVLALVEE